MKFHLALGASLLLAVVALAQGPGQGRGARGGGQGGAQPQAQAPAEARGGGGRGGQPASQTQTFDTSAGPVKITPIYHASTLIEADGKVIYVDLAPPSPTQGLQPGDLFLITDIHGDHMNKDLVAQLSKAGTTVIAAPEVVKTVTNAKPLANGEKTTWDKWNIEAVPAYNIMRKDPMGNPYHPKGRGNGYVLTYGGKRFYFSGDTENIPEMRALQNIDVAFMCMNLPFTMTPEEAADAALAFKPKVVFPYHYGQYNVAVFMAKVIPQGIDARALNWYPQSGPNGRGSQSQAPTGGGATRGGRGAN
jgi:L-ascorbate metabolism protein UlaG (beta-lactamase superfamily)